MMTLEEYRMDGTFIKYNAHPKKMIVNDCVKRALSFATGIDYMEMARYLNKIKREVNAKEFNQTIVWKTFIDKHSYAFNKISFPAEKGIVRMNGLRFANSHPKGMFILRTAHHLTVCYNGSIVDTWDCRDKCVYNAYEVIADVKF